MATPARAVMGDEDFGRYVKRRLGMREGETFDHALEEYVGVAVANAMAGEFERGVQHALREVAKNELRADGHTIGCPMHLAGEWVDRYVAIVSPGFTRQQCKENLVRLFTLQRLEEAKETLKHWGRESLLERIKRLEAVLRVPV